MSATLVEQALSAPILHSGAKFVLVILASLCDDDGRCSPTVPRIARIAGKSRSAVGRNVVWLEAEGWLERHNRNNLPTVFELSPALKTGQVRAGDDARAHVVSEPRCVSRAYS